MQGGFVAIVFKNIPAAKDQIIKPSQGYEILDERAIIIRALAQTNGAILGQGTYRSSQTFFNQLHTRNNRGTHSSHTGEEYTQLPSGRHNRHLPLLHTYSPLVDRSISSQHERRDSKPGKTDNRASHAGLQTDLVSVHLCAMCSGKIRAAATALPGPLQIVQTERKVLQNTRALRVWSVLPTVTCHALASDPLQPALRAT